MTSLSDLTVLVTGATSGYGAAIARRFATAGAAVIGTGRRQERLDALAASYGVRPLAFDVTDREAARAALASLDGRYAQVDVLVNNAGLALGLDPAWKADLGDWDTMIATNVSALVFMTRALLPGMVERGGGHVVNVSSIAGSWPYPGGHVYGASKAFVTQLSANLRADLVGTGVRVTNVEPGLSETEFSLVRFKGDEAAAAAPYANTDALSAEDIAEAVVWAVSQPPHVNVSRIELFPTSQAHGAFQVARR
jgi:3-hydroxy acid dehydrogenase/malonic semialdehyde reductase